MKHYVYRIGASNWKRKATKTILSARYTGKEIYEFDGFAPAKAFVDGDPSYAIASFDPRREIIASRTVGFPDWLAAQGASLPEGLSITNRGVTK